MLADWDWAEIAGERRGGEGVEAAVAGLHIALPPCSSAAAGGGVGSRASVRAGDPRAVAGREPPGRATDGGEGMCWGVKGGGRKIWREDPLGLWITGGICAAHAGLDLLVEVSEALLCRSQLRLRLTEDGGRLASASRRGGGVGRRSICDVGKANHCV